MQTDFTLQDIYRSLDVSAGLEIPFQHHLNEMVKKTIGRDLSHAFYDVTSCFFEIDFSDGDDDLRRRGVSKEHRVDPIVALGLFMDSNGLPVSMSVFPGNTNGSVTLQPSMKEIKESYGLGRLIVTADKGLNSSKSINALVNAGDGFVFSQILKGKKGQRYHDRLFDPEGWTVNAGGTYRFKSFVEEYTGHDAGGRKVTRRRKVLLYWNKAEAQMAARKWEEKLKKAERNVRNNAYSIKKGADEYTKETAVDRQTSEFLENTKTLRSVNLVKAESDALYDDFFCLITSKLDYDEKQIRQAYSGLWRIEDSFCILKSDLYARPVFVSTNEHIRAHFLICFISLLILRIIQYKMGDRALSAERTARALNAAACRVLKGGIVHLDDVGGAAAYQKKLNQKGEWIDTLEYSDEDEIALDYRRIQETFGTDIYQIYHRQEEFNRLLKNISVS